MLIADSTISAIVFLGNHRLYLMYSSCAPLGRVYKPPNRWSNERRNHQYWSRNDFSRLGYVLLKHCLRKVAAVIQADPSNIKHYLLLFKDFCVDDFLDTKEIRNVVEFLIKTLKLFYLVHGKQISIKQTYARSRLYAAKAERPNWRPPHVLKIVNFRIRN